MRVELRSVAFSLTSAKSSRSFVTALIYAPSWSFGCLRTAECSGDSNAHSQVVTSVGTTLCQQKNKLVAVVRRSSHCQDLDAEISRASCRRSMETQSMMKGKEVSNSRLSPLEVRFLLLFNGDFDVRLL